MAKLVKKKMATKKALDAELKKLVKAAAAQEKVEQAAYKLDEKSRMLAWRATARAYLWWREANQQPAYLEKLYADNNIANNKPSDNRINFNPLVRLIWEIPKIRAAYVSSLAQSISALDEEFTDNPDLYKNEAQDNLVSFILDNGGLAGIRAKSSLKFDAEDVVIPEPPKNKKAEKPLGPSPQVQKELLKRQKSNIATMPTIGTINVGEVAVDTNNSTGNNLIAILARREAAGTLTAIGTTNDTALIEQIALACIQIDQSRLTPILRLIVECLRPHVLPRVLHKRRLRDKFFTTHKVKIGDDKKKVDMHESVRFVLLRDGRVLISKRGSRASLITISEPKEVKLAFSTAIIMRGADRFWMETDLINEGMIALYTSVPVDALNKATKSKMASNELTLENDFKIGKRVIYFYDFAVLTEDFQRQPTISDPDKIKYDWEIETSKTFIDRIAAKHFDEWLVHVRDYIHLAHTKSFQLVFADKHLEVRSDWKPEQTKGYARLGPRFSSSYGNDATIKRNVKANCEITVSPLDIIELFATLRSLKLNGKVMIKGNSSVMRVSYETDTADHVAYIPACDVRGHRDATHFKTFVP